MRVEQLRSLLRILEAGSFRQAADELHLSQPALSESLKALERELGAQLLERSRSGVRLTDVGREVLPYIRTIVEAETALKSEVEGHQGLVRGSIRIASTNAGTNTILPSVLRSFHARFPDVRVQVTEAGSLQIEEKIRDGQYDLGLVVNRSERDSFSSSIVAQPLLASPLIVCVPSDHPFAQHDTVGVEDVARQPLILFPSGYFMHDLTLQLLADRQLNVVFYSDNTDSVKRMIAGRIGITILPEFSVYPDLTRDGGEIRHVLLRGDHEPLGLHLIRRRAGYTSRAIREVWGDLVTEAQRVACTLDQARARSR
jgi:DNA-binding transcriptional LysR family regulator